VLKIINYVIISLTLVLLFGCTSTLQRTKNLARGKPLSELAEITVIRSSSWLGGANPFGIRDNDTAIGVLGPGGELTWFRPAGYMALEALNSNITPTHVLIVRVEAGKKYSFKTNFKVGGVVTLDPVDETIIVYELVADSINKSVNYVQWKHKLEQLTTESK
jgi:hypothetical protein